MIPDAALVVMLVPVASLAAAGVTLLSTRARVAALLVLLACAGMLCSMTAWWTGHGETGRYLLVGSLELPAALAVLAYPRPGWRHPVDFCAWVAVAGAGLIGSADTAIYGPMALAIGLALMAHLWWRFEVGDEPDRQAVLWLVLGMGSSGLLFGHSVFVFDRETSLIVGLCLFTVIGPAMVIGVRRPDLVDVRGLVVQTVVLGVVLISYVAAFVGLVSLLDILGTPHPKPGQLALLGAVAAVGFHPLRVMLRGVIDELLFGDRPDPLDAATHVADRIGDDPVLALRAIREALVLPYASLSAGGTELATSGTAVTHTRRLPLSLGPDTLGEIVVGLRPGDLTLSAGDEHVLRIVAPLLAQTLRARALAEDLKESRGAAIAAIEEERRRLRRDLHDGLGPTLSGIAFTADAARNTLHDDPGSADDLLLGLRADAVTAIGEIRRLVYGMRPPALDELGLVPALRQQTSSVRTTAGRPMIVSVEAPPDLPRPRPSPTPRDTAAPSWPGYGSSSRTSA